MTACIVGWAHTPFGRLEGETVESLIVRVATEALADAGLEARDVDEIVLGHFNAGFSAQDFTASLVLQASPDLRFKRASRVENACATGSAAVHQGLKAIAARSARIVLVVGVEQMTTTPAAEIGQQSAQGLLCARGSRHRGRLRRHFRPDRGTLFPALRRPVRCARPHRRQESQERRRQSVSRRCARTSATSSAGAESEKNPLVAGPLKRTDCSLVSDGAAAIVLADVDTALGWQGGRVPRGRARAGFPADGQARHPQVRRLRAGLAARAGGGRALRSAIFRSSRPTTASPSPS